MVPSIETEGLWAELEQLRREAVVLAWAEEAMDAQGWRVTVRAGRIDGDLVVQVEARVAGLERPKAETPPRDALIAEERPIHPSAAAGRSMVAVSPVAVVATSWSTEDDLDLYQAAEDGRPIAEVAQDLERPIDEVRARWGALSRDTSPAQRKAAADALRAARGGSE